MLTVILGEHKSHKIFSILSFLFFIVTLFRSLGAAANSPDKAGQVLGLVHCVGEHRVLSESLMTGTYIARING
jgi:hypothetical protein